MVFSAAMGRLIAGTFWTPMLNAFILFAATATFQEGNIALGFRYRIVCALLDGKAQTF
jgi:hypothetical protein